MPAPYRANVFAAGDCQRRLDRVYAQRLEITPARLAELAGDRTLKSGKIARQFGYGRAAFFTYLSQHEELWRVYETARLGAGFQVNKSRMRTRRGALTDDELKIINVIRHGVRVVGEIAAASGVEPRLFASCLYNLESEKHEIWSAAIGLPPVTHFFLRDEEEEGSPHEIEKLISRGKAKGKSA